MKNFTFLFTMFILGVAALAQTPQAFKYQTVARNSAGEILVNQNISFLMTIIQGALPGTAVYTEIHTATTNASGLATLEIGRGTPVSVNFATINWSTTPIFLKTEIDPAGGSAFVEMGTSELLSVPYAFESNHAKKASALNLIDENGNEYAVSVDTLGNLVVLPILPEWQCGNSFTDHRDSNSYTTVQIGTQCWMAKNLNIGTMIIGTNNMANDGVIEKYCFDDNTANCDIFGGLYQWNEAMQYSTQQGLPGICPNGWHFPSDNEITALSTYLGGTEVAGGKLKTTGTIEAGTGLWYSPNTWATNSSGFSGLPDGARSPGSGFFGIGNFGSWWSSTQYSTNSAWHRSLAYSDSEVYRYVYDKKYGYSVRCLRDASTTITIPTVTTTSISNITESTAISGGNVTSEGGSSVIARGICWSTSPNPNISNYKTINGNGTGIFTSNLLNLLLNTVYYVKAYATNSAGTAYGEQVSFTTSAFAIGQSYGGGIIFYIDGTGLHGLISATTDQSTGTPWGCHGTTISGADGTAIGTGNQNTIDIEAGCTTSGIAADICTNLTFGGYDDWFLPSTDELNQMYVQRAAIGGFASTYYWCSSEYSSDVAWLQYFSNGGRGWGNKGDTYNVRAIRAF